MLSHANVSFFIADNIENLIHKHGNKNRYDLQKINFKIENITEKKIVSLIKILHQYKQGLDQEIFIENIIEW